MEAGLAGAGPVQLPTEAPPGDLDGGAWGRPDQRLISVEDEVAALRAEVAELRGALERLQEQLGG